mmetsp:Transcript_21738/g.33552  ORF Transcript_21738/g.33552 Transcript_21738/m.33552 type:complete len:96 (+) Transcript_21738:844-1131(+)
MILLLSLLVILTGRDSSASKNLLLNPATVFNSKNSAPVVSSQNSTASSNSTWIEHVPPVQTLLTCQLIDDNVITLALNLFLLNFIALMNRKSLEF